LTHIHIISPLLQWKNSVILVERETKKIFQNHA
jgi:hypothetical protein